jgi:hypothetical protein
MSTEPDRLDVGEEVARLTEALAGWWTSATKEPSADPAPPDDRAPRDDTDHDDPGHRDDDAGRGGSCCVCPVCRVLDLVRDVRPDVLDQVAMAAETVALLIREATGSRRAEPARAEPWRPGTAITVTDADEADVPDEQQEGHGAWG